MQRRSRNVVDGRRLLGDGRPSPRLGLLVVLPAHACVGDPGVDISIVFLDPRCVSPFSFPTTLGRPAQLATGLDWQDNNRNWWRNSRRLRGAITVNCDQTGC